MLNCIKFFVLTSTFLFVSFGFGQSIWTNPITGTNPNTDNPYTTGDVSDVNISVSGIGRGTGINGTNANNRYNANGWNTPSIDLTKYFEWTITPDVGCEINFSSFVYTSQASGTGPTSFAFRSSVDGFSVNIGAPTVGGTTLNLSVPAYQNISTPITFRFYGWGTTNSGGTFSINNFTFNGTTSCGPPPSNTITTGTVSPLTYNVDCTTGEAGTVGFTSTEVYNGGNVFTAELSDATGSFAAPTSIGTLAANGPDPSGTINITIPAGTASGTGYRIRIVSSDPVVTGSDNGTDITINLTGGPCVLIPPHLTSVIINSCNSSCDEGQNELVFGNTGDYSILVNEANFNFSYTNSGPFNNYTDNLTNNASTTQEINDECPSTDPFIDAYGLTIPPNSSWVLANDAICPTDALDWTGLCNSGPIYIIYSTDPDWSHTGNFSNNPSSSNPLRPYQTSMTTTSGDTFTIDYETDGSLYPNDDGVFATFGYNGGSATSYGDDDCSFNVSVLPIELNSFIGSYNGKSTDLFWQTLSEQNNDYFALYHSTNGKMFDRIGTVSGSGNTSTLLHYSFEHSTPRPGINYYKLKSVDYDGTVHDKGIISVLVEMNHVFYNQTTMSIQMNYESDYSVYGSDGRLVKRVTNQNTIPFTGKGIYHVIDERSGKSFKLGIW